MNHFSRLHVLLGTTVFASFAVAVLLFAAEPPPAKSRPEMWKKVDDAINKGLPKTAVQELEPIIESALKDKAYPEAVKAICKKIAYEGNVQGNKPEEKITRMQAEIAKAPKEMVPIMDAVLANWYWHYFQQNRWRFQRRTATAAAPGNDFTTWDLPRLFAEIDKQFTKALAAEKELKATPIATYDALLEKGTQPDSYRPTLFDFVAFEALHFYAAGEQAGAKAEDVFEFDANSPALAPVEEFLKWQPATTDADSPKLKAFKLYQNLLTFHQDDKDKAAFLDADLFRLQFAHAHAFGEEKAARFKAAMKAFADKYADHELSAMARHHWAAVLHGENEFVEARAIAMQGKNAFPNSTGGKMCHNLILQIEAKDVQVLTERVWTDPLPVLRVKYRNVTKVYFRAVKTDWPARLTKEHWRPEYFHAADQNTFTKAKPDLEWSADLPATEDYLERSQDVPAPKGLKPGFYFILASVKADFSDGDNMVTATDVWVSDLAVVIRQGWNPGKLEGFVLTAKGGDPVPNAKVRVWVRNNQDNSVKEEAAVTTDANGLFAVNGPAQRAIFLLATHDGQALAAQNEHYLNTQPENYRPHTQTVLFTDRSLYRPGQTIYFKGICLFADTKADDYKVQANRKVTVVFNDHNGKAVAQTTATSNGFGSFSGTFTAPRDRLAGQMHVLVPGEGGGAVHFNVEEYKRPKFQVTVDAPKDAPKLGGEVKVVGKATAYTGAAINGAKVRYRVTREVRWPAWFYDCYYWRLPPNPGAAQEIAHGTATTEADGTFSVTFTAKPDLSVPEKDEPTFHFTVHADVIDTTGETRSGSKGVVVGYTALQATLTADEWQTIEKDVLLKLATTTLDGEGQAAKGVVKVHTLKAPDAVQRPDILGQPVQPRPGRGRGGKVPPMPLPRPDSSDIRTWALGEVVKSLDFATEKDGKKELGVKLEVGVYRAIVETQDRFGKPVTAQLNLRVINPADAKLGIKVPELFAAPKWTLEPGEEFAAVWGTGYDRGRAFVEVEHRGKLIQSFWTDPEKTLVSIKQKIDEAMRGGFQVRTTFVRENRGYLESRHVDVPWSNKDLTVKWDHFVSKLEPAKKETFTATITGPKAAKAVAEMVAALYDASLDAYLPHNWMQKFNVFRQDYSHLNSSFENAAKYLWHFRGNWSQPYQSVDLRYRALPADITANLWGYMYLGRGGTMRFATPGGMPPAPASPMAADAVKEDGLQTLEKATSEGLGADRKQANRGLGLDGRDEAGKDSGGDGPDLSKVAARKNLNETAFFFPQLASGADGSVKMEFTMPEALTKWKFMGFAHDKNLKSGYLQDEVVTAKDLMVQPNPPRFLREGDVVEFTVKVSNQSATKQVGRVRLNLLNALTAQPVDKEFGNAAGDQSFDIPSGESRSFAWKLTVPDGAYPIIYKAVGGTDRLSDGEEGMLPVLSKRVLVTESIPLPIRGKTTKTFEFQKLQDAAKSNTLKSQSLTVQMTSQPAWYAVLALPYLMEFPHECTEQTFNRLYANSLAKHVAASDPKIRRVFDTWKNLQPGALDSPLEKNQDVKAAMIDETPWLRDAVRESEARRNVGVLFDENRLNDETGRLLKKLGDQQRADGTWPWFPGGPKNEYITLYIVTGFGRMRHLGVKADAAPAVKAVTALDAWADEQYKWILKHSPDPETNHLSSTIALYLYGRSFFLQDKPVAKEHQTALDYWQRQARNHWLKLANRQSQAHLALGLKRFGDKDTPKAILASIKERSVSNEEMGMFWRDTELSWWWYHAPIETQAVMIEAFDEIMNDAAAVEDCKVWLLKQKQTQNWKTTKATADAVYALLLRGDNLLKSDALVEVKLGGEAIKPENVEAGTGFYEQKFQRGEIKPEQGKITVTKADAGVSWGSVHWQYLEDISKVTPHDGTPLKLEKKLFKKTLTKKGPVLEAVTGPVAVGDEIVCRVVLRTDRDMEYVHLKDHRGSGTEPVNVLSQYKFQDGLYYYESTKDVATHFFIDYLPKGVSVFEYTVRVQLKGQYPTGLANIQCMYAPEFSSHSESIMLEVK
ncbi:alpha-2-macroglobulin family protein [Limnoglobus roseus]|uniref:Alpha-2-macroglobulin domain protein n=1 Tax=Limnoglobus roseus TaxID=2598579 RepID=A0A5C1ABY7_9BACT|nr:alpha-2-macroglobulin family protein [Limnoglobus roseus]QEL14538.1 alpha-2-macroglobulin domain protein [Limnoglobus roseus]